MKKKINSKNLVALFFVLFIVAGGALTLAMSPKQIMGGLVRGYLNSPKESNLFEKANASLREFDNRISEYFVFHDLSIHAYGGIQKAINRTLIDDIDKSSQVLKLNNGYLTFKDNSNDDLTQLSSYLIDLKKACDSTGSKLLYVNKVSKDTSDYNLLPQYYPYVYSSNLEDIKSILKSKNIPVLDIGEEIIKNDIDKYSLFFKTDHHWTPQAGIWVSQNICKEINKSYGWNLDTNTYNIDNYDVKTYPNSFLGSQGKRVGALYDGIDDFYVVCPSFNTNLTVEINDIGFNETGSFKETIIHEESITSNNLLNKDDTAYDAYMQGNHALVKIKNHNIKSDKRAVLVLDSYGCVVAPYLSLQFSELDCIDIRSFKDSVKDYIVESKPDILIYSIENHQ